MERIRPTAQVYGNYTPEDFLVWQLLFERQMVQLRSMASTAYLGAVERIGFTADAIPRFENINTRLDGLTGWKLQVVPGEVPARDFFEMLARRIFPATCWLRTYDELDYVEEPDMFHDVFGHVPLLADEAYADFIHAFGQLAQLFIDDEAAITQLSRLYWFTIEFGLIREHGQRRIYGAGILSSPAESKHSLSDAVSVKPFAATEVLARAFRTDVMQDCYYMIDSFDALSDILSEVGTLLSIRKKIGTFL
jgi:phenylalanine-4-hydroxylase